MIQIANESNNHDKTTAVYIFTKIFSNHNNNIHRLCEMISSFHQDAMMAAHLRG